MPAAIAIPAIIGAAGVGVQAIGAVKASHAARDAATTQSTAADQALSYSQRATDDTLGYLRAGQADAYARYQPSNTRAALGSLVGVPAGGTPYGATGGNFAPNGQMAGPSPLSLPGQQGGGMVLMRAPNGMTKRVPQAQVAHYQQAGAQVIQ